MSQVINCFQLFFKDGPEKEDAFRRVSIYEDIGCGNGKVGFKIELSEWKRLRELRVLSLRLEISYFESR